MRGVRVPMTLIAVIGDVDVALVWGPLAGYFSKREPVALRLEPIADDHQWKMFYDISVGVRRNDTLLRQRLDAALLAEHPAIAQLLREYRVPDAGGAAH